MDIHYAGFKYLSFNSKHCNNVYLYSYNVIRGTVMKLSGMEYFLRTIIKFCNSKPTCEGCIFNKKRIGCYFRGKSPREWKIEEIEK